MCNAILFANPFDMDSHQAWPLEPGITVADWISQNTDKVDLTRPTLVMLNGDELVEADWHTVLNDGDTLYFTRIPQATFVAAAVKFIAAYWVQIAAVATLAVTLYGIAT